MQLSTYLQETAAHASRNLAILDSARSRIANTGINFTPIEYGGILHALQTLIENAIGKAKHLCKHHTGTVPTNSYAAITQAHALGYIGPDQLQEWRQIIGLRNRIVHDYLNIDERVIYEVIERRDYSKVEVFLLNTTLLINKNS